MTISVIISIFAVENRKHARRLRNEIELCCTRLAPTLQRQKENIGDMKQEVFAAIVMCVFGTGLIFVPAHKVWSFTEKWKTIGGKGPSKTFIVITRILGLAFVAVGLGLLICGS